MTRIYLNMTRIDDNTIHNQKMVLKWEHPFTAILAGPTSCGKSTFVKKFLSEITVMVDTFFFEVIYCLPEDQPIDSFFLKFRVCSEEHQNQVLLPI